MDRHLISFISSDDMISKLRFTHVFGQSLILVNISSSIQLEYIDVMQVIEVLSVESTKNDHATSYKSSTVSAPWFGMISNHTSNFQAFKRVVNHIDHQNIVKVTTESSGKDVYFSIKDCGRMSPPGQKGSSFEFSLNPN